MSIENEKPKREMACAKFVRWCRTDDPRIETIGPIGCGILSGLSSFFHYESECSVSISTLRKTCFASVRSIKEYIVLFENLELILIERRNGAKNIYIWNVPFIPYEQIYHKNNIAKG